MKSTVVDESLSSLKPMYCSREYQASTRLSQQYEKSTSNETLIILIQMKFGLHNIPVVFKIFPLQTCIEFSLLNNINTTQTVTISSFMHVVHYVKYI